MDVLLSLMTRRERGFYPGRMKKVHSMYNMEEIILERNNHKILFKTPKIVTVLACERSELVGLM